MSRYNVIFFTGAGISVDSGIPTFQEQPGIRDKLSRDFANTYPEEYRETIRGMVNQEVAEDAALYWSKEPGNLAALIDRAEKMTAEEIAALGEKARKRIADAYSWEFISGEYRKLFLKNRGNES